jgi:hypothetical protein
MGSLSRTTVVVSLGIACAVLGALAWSSSSTAAPPVPQAHRRDPGAELACRAFTGVLADAATLTPAELRDRLRRVYDEAKVYPESTVAVESRAALVAITDGDRVGFAQHAAALDAACRP